MERAKAGRLPGKIALITGAASGIGRATVALFHAEGAKVAATDRNEAGLGEAKAFADLVLPQDVTDEARWRQVARPEPDRSRRRTDGAVAAAFKEKFRGPPRLTSPDARRRRGCAPSPSYPRVSRASRLG